MSATSHPIEPEEVMAYLDGELPLDRAATAATHLERCADCRAIAADLQSASQRLMAWQVEPSDPRITPALAAALAQRASRRQGWREVVKRPWFWPLAAAAVAVLVMVPVRRTREHSLANQSFSIDGLLQPDTNGQLQPDNAPTAAKLPVDALEPASPMIARTAALNLVTPEFDRTRAALEDILKRHHGYVATLNLAAPDGSGRTLTAAVRVPAAELEAAIAELKKLGRVESEQRSGEEITHQYVDLEARLANARHTEQLLTDLLRQQTGKLSDVLAVEVEIGRVRGDIERMEAELKSLANRVDFATLNLTVSEDYKARLQVVPNSTLGRFRNAAVEGYRTMAAGVVDVAVFLIAAAPTLFLLAVLFIPARAVWRKVRRVPASRR